MCGISKLNMEIDLQTVACPSGRRVVFIIYPKERLSLYIRVMSFLVYRFSSFLSFLIMFEVTIGPYSRIVTLSGVPGVCVCVGGGGLTLNFATHCKTDLWCSSCPNYYVHSFMAQKCAVAEKWSRV